MMSSELYGTLQNGNFEKAWLVTSSDLTPDASNAVRNMSELESNDKILDMNDWFCTPRIIQINLALR